MARLIKDFFYKQLIIDAGEADYYRDKKTSPLISCGIVL